MLHEKLKSSLNSKYDKYKHFYLRVNRPDGKHRIGIIALALDKSKKNIVATATLCSVDDRFDSAEGRVLAYRRLDKAMGNPKVIVKEIGDDISISSIINRVDPQRTNKWLPKIDISDGNFKLKRELEYLKSEKRESK